MRYPFATIRQSPFVFALRIAVAEFIFSIALIFVATSAAVQLYEQTDAADVVSFPLLLALGITLVQTVIVFATFMSWYYPVYRLAPAAILLHSGPLAQERTLVEARAIGHVETRRGWLAQRLGYGTVLIEGRNGQVLAKLKHVHDPEVLAEQVRTMMQEETALPALLNSPIPALIAAGEGEFIEFKASLMWDYRKQSVNKELHEPVMKNLVGFMNSRGGLLLIGVDDEGSVLGIEPDLKTLRKPGVDGFENVFNVAFGNMVGMEYRPFVTLTFPVLEDKTICAISVRPSTHPAYLRYQGKEEFYLRTGNSSNALGVSAAVQYIQSRFG
ncbi:MAG TPA: PH domain-containing protein [Chloroflexi bacterium]|nr:PH domain-containing protein [Chloroflexota bacterium]